MKKITLLFKVANLVLLFSIFSNYSVNAQQIEINEEAPSPTLTSVSAAPVCEGNSTNIILSGLIPNSSGFATYKIGSQVHEGPLGTVGDDGIFTFDSEVLNLNANGVVFEITKITNTSGISTSFTNKKFTFVVHPKPTLTSVTATPVCAGNVTTITLSGLIPNSKGFATYKVGNQTYTGDMATAGDDGTFTFNSTVLGANANGVVFEITKMTSEFGCETTFTNKKVTFVVHPKPTLSTVTAMPVCAGNTTAITLSGLIPNSKGFATYKVGNQTYTGDMATAGDDGTFTFNSTVLGANANGVVFEITKMTSEFGCETTFTNKKVTFVVHPKPTLSTVTAMPVCAGNTTAITLSGLIPNSKGFATYKVLNQTYTGDMATAGDDGTFTFNSTVLGANANGVVFEITKMTSEFGCETTFTNKKVTFVVHPKPTLSTVTAEPVFAGNPTTITLSGLIPLSSGHATYKLGNQIIEGPEGTASAEGTYSFVTQNLPIAANGMVVEIIKLQNNYDCETTFIDKQVVLVVNSQESTNFTTAKVNVSLYPNPVSDILNIQTDSDIQTVDLLNFNGQKVLSSNQKQLNVSHLQAGIYIVRVQDKANNVVLKKVSIK